MTGYYFGYAENRTIGCTRRITPHHDPAIARQRIFRNSQDRLKSIAYILSRVEWKIIGFFNMTKENLYSGSRKKRITEARSLVCYWCIRVLGKSMTDVAKLLGLT